MKHVSVARPVQRGLAIGSDKEASVRPEPRRRGLGEDPWLAEPPLPHVRADSGVGRETGHQRAGNLGVECLRESPGLAKLHVQEAAAVEYLDDSLDAAAEARCHATGEHNAGDRAAAQGIDTHLERARAGRIAGRREHREIFHRRRLDGACDDVAANRQLTRHEPGAQCVERVGVEVVACEQHSRLDVDLIETHRDPAGRGSETSYGVR